MEEKQKGKERKRSYWEGNSTNGEKWKLKESAPTEIGNKTKTVLLRTPDMEGSKAAQSGLERDGPFNSRPHAASLFVRCWYEKYVTKRARTPEGRGVSSG